MDLQYQIDGKTLRGTARGGSVRRACLLSSHGGVLIELALVIPVVLAIFFGALNIILLINSSVSLHTLMGDISIIAPSRSNAQALNLDIGVAGNARSGIIDELHQWYDTPATDFSGLYTDPVVKTLFHKDVDQLDFQNHMTREVFRYGTAPTFTKSSGSVTPTDFPIFYYYALAYIYQGMRRSVGESIKYPCTGEKGCLSCGFYATIPGADENTTQDLSTEPIIGSKDMHMICKFEPTGFSEIRKVIQVEGSKVLR